MSARSNAGRIGIWGASGSGKSSYAKQMIQTRRRVVIFDPVGEYSGKQFRTCKGIWDAIGDSYLEFQFVLRPTTGKEPKFLNSLAANLLTVQEPFKEGRRGAPMLTLVVEEMNTSFPVNKGVSEAPAFAEICSRGRHYGIEVVGVSQRIAEVDTRFRGNCDETVVFRQKGPRDKQAASAETGAPVSDLPKENLQYIHEKGGVITRGELTHSAPKKRRAPAKKKRP